MELNCGRSGALLGPSGHPLPALPQPDLQGGETQDTQPQSPQVHDIGEPWEGFPRMSMGWLGGRVGDTEAHRPFHPCPSAPPPPQDT